MKRFSFKVVTLVLSVIILVLPFAGCSSRGKDPGGKSSGNGQQVNSTDQNTKPKEKMKIVYANWTSGAVDSHSIAEEELEKIFTDVDFVLVPMERATYEQQLTTRIAGGDVPDIFKVEPISIQTNLARQGLLAEIPVDKVKQYAPDYFKATQEYGVEVFLSGTVNGKNYNMPMMNWKNQYPLTDAWRKDWLDNVGIAKVPETLDEMEAALRKIVNEDPDNNGKKDTYGISVKGKDALGPSFGTIFGAFGIFPDKYMKQPDGSFKLGILTPQAKEALALLSKWYKEGLVDPEFITTDAKIQTQKWANGKVGYIETTWTRLYEGTEHYTALMTANPNAKLVMAPPVKGRNGNYGYSGWGKIGTGWSFGLQVGKNTEKFAKCIEIIGKIYSDYDINTLIRYGVEGTHWKRNEQNGGIQFIPPYDTAEQKAKLGIYLNFPPGTTDIMKKQDRKDIDELSKYAFQSTIKDGKDYIGWVGCFTDQELAKKYGTDLSQIIAKWEIDLINGAKPIDQFEKFVKEWEDAGGKEIAKDYNEAYKKGKPIIDSYMNVK